MRIFLKKIGTTLISRPAGKEAFLGVQPLLKNVGKKETIEIDFAGVAVLTPSWTDEFLTPLSDKYQDRLRFFNTENASVKMTLEILEKTKGSH